MSFKISCLIIDDDPFIQDLLSDKLSFFNEIEVIGQALNGRDGLKQIEDKRPDLVFLDVEMTDMTGFELLSSIHDIHFKTIFITSYGHYAIKAIRFNALDYLLKPIDLEELRNAIRRFKEQGEKEPSNKARHLVNNLKRKAEDQLLILKVQEGEFCKPLKDIICIEGDRNYSRIKLVGGSAELVAKTLSYFEELLEDKDFFRIHKSTVINRLHISKVKNEFIVLSTGEEIAISRRRKSDFIAWFNKDEV
ncbi:LytTR family DNA-binding domain-containing protein [Roseivirga sp. E12]|uniref:LytR/AlgR family response regulator transcription factor n=1 Tax=Roseivirga sp. E12 TaxID=2819237 RepID=UPI001ABCD18D|nr:LytTR family DNA-binding domain-containing protein [Roseivirga sp. E12]MBO3697297.1 response regulator transcription factor [Roseivirga sp. E12]